jgi:23S rRNA (pseudouridine1915-N3)-methyltransferase
MKFSDIEDSDWSSLQPYLDTCLLPVTGLTGTEHPVDVTKRLERLRDAMDYIEIPFKGRVVTYPAVHYILNERAVDDIDACCFKLKENLFKQVIVITAEPAFAHWQLQGADLFLYVDLDKPDDEESKGIHIANRVQEMWQFSKDNHQL